MKCLAVNTATTVLSVALADGGKMLHRFATTETRDQGNILLEQARAGLDAAGIGFQDLDLLAVVTGPGSFTGIRIGLAGMRGIALAAGKPLIGLSSFALFAAPAPPGGVNVVAVESWREELYFQIGGEAPVNENPADFARRLAGRKEPLVLSGDAAEKLAPLLPAAKLHAPLADAADAARIAMARFAAEGAAAATPRPSPFYLRPADVTLKTGGRRIEGAEDA